MSEEKEAPLNWPTAVTLIAFIALMGSIMYFDYSCSCQGCTDYSCESPTKEPTP